jgi:hypothetical protein
VIDRRMDAYYYGFEPTGVDCIDKILSAVACAGKAFHHTQDWSEHIKVPYEDHSGDTPIDWIQNAANEASATIIKSSGVYTDTVEEAIGSLYVHLYRLRKSEMYEEELAIMKSLTDMLLADMKFLREKMNSNG